MKKISKEIFSPYVYEKDSIRPMLEKPYPCGDYYVATDTVVLLMIKKDLVEGTFDEVKHAPNALKVIPQQNCELLLDRNTIISALDNLPHEKEIEEVEPAIDCPECDGDGEVEWEYQDRKFYHHTKFMECPCCKGSGILRDAITRETGKMKVDCGSYIVLNGVNVWGPVLEVLVETIDMLGIKEVKLLTLRKDNSCMIKIAEGILFIFMSTYSLDHAVAVYHVNIMPK